VTFILCCHGIGVHEQAHFDASVCRFFRELQYEQLCYLLLEYSKLLSCFSLLGTVVIQILLHSLTGHVFREMYFVDNHYMICIPCNCSLPVFFHLTSWVQSQMLMFLYQHREQLPVSLLSEFVKSLWCEPKLLSDWCRMTAHLLAHHCLHSTSLYQQCNKESYSGTLKHLKSDLLPSNILNEHGGLSCNSYPFSTSASELASELCKSLASDLQPNNPSVYPSVTWSVPCPLVVSAAADQQQFSGVQSSQFTGASGEVSHDLLRSACDALVDSEEAEKVSMLIG
jgi:hypothetical protein